MKTIVLMAMLAAEPALPPGIAAVNQFSQPMQLSFLHKQGPREAQHVPVALSPDEEKFLSLLREKVESGGPPKDGIPAIDRPQYTSAPEANQWLLPEDIVFGVDYKGLVAAYPQRILVWHEIANESLGNEKLSITYCPLT